MPITLMNKITGYTLAYEIRAKVSAISRGGRTVEFKGSNAYVDIKTGVVTLPGILESAIYDHSSGAILRAYAAHEAAHCRYTNLKRFPKELELIKIKLKSRVESKHIDKVSHLFKSFWNILEDKRIEQKLPIDYPGTYQDLAHLRAKLSEESVANQNDEKDQINLIFLSGLQNLLLAQAILANRWPSQKFDQAYIDYIEKLNPEIHSFLNPYIEKIQNLETEDQVYKLSHELIDGVLNYLDKKENNPSEENSSNGNDMNTENDKNKNDNENLKSENSESIKEEIPSEDDSKETGSSSKNESQSDINNTVKRPEIELEKKLKDYLEEFNNENFKVLDIEKALDKILENTQKQIKEIKSVYGNNAIIRDICKTEIKIPKPSICSLSTKKPSQRLSSIIKSMVITTNRVRISRRHENGIFDHTNILSLSTGDNDIYTRRYESRSTATAWLTLVDQSGSMQHILSDAISIASATVEASFGIPKLVSSVLSYTSEMEKKNQWKLIIQEISNFGDASPKVRANLKGWSENPGKLGGTPTGDAILEGLRRLETRQEKRKIMLVISDGQPDDASLAQRAHDICKQKNITLCLIEIGHHKTPFMKFDISRVASNISKLPEILKEIAHEILTKI